MNLGNPPIRYDTTYEARRNLELGRADRMNLKNDADAEFVNNKLILRSPNGSRFYLAVSNAGVLTATAL